MITAATSAKMAMQITVTNQKTKSIRSACLLAGSGSQGTSRATAAAPAPKSIPRRTSWTIDPLRTGAETTPPEGRTAREVTGRDGNLETPATREVHGQAEAGTRTAQPLRRNRWDSVLACY